MNLRSLCILGSDTGVGKTTVSSALLRLARRRNLRLAPYKPVETGYSSSPTDAERLARAAALADFTAHDAGLYRFADPLAPSIAARLAGSPIDVQKIVDRAKALLSNADALLFESAGGLLTPYGPGMTSASVGAALADNFAMDTLLISADRLGTINQTALAVEQLRRTGCALVGIILVRVSATATPDQPYNAEELRTLTGVAVLGTLRHCPSLDPDDVADALAEDVDLRSLLDGRLARA